MRYAVIVVLLLLAIFAMPASAQLMQGVYEFEDTIGSMSYSGVWSTLTITGTVGGVSRTTSAAGASVSFTVEGHSLTIWRLMRITGNSSRMNLCVGVSCILVINESTTTNNFWYPVTVTLPPGPQTITVTQTLGQIYLDSFMVLNDPVTAGMPTAVPTVPTATILPSSTPAFTATPGNTPVPTATIVPSSTPAPTATPYELPGAIYAIDPAVRYGMINGQITSTRYGMAAPDYISLFLLSALLGVNAVGLGLNLWRRK